MPCQSSDELKKLVKEARTVTKHGQVADYIPALGKVNAHDLSIAINYPDGRCISAGDIERKISLQSISKVISLALQK
ncbi:glutaminase [Lederbergia galactosidilyticus]|nr:glutaminase [Lederbergia galactosidilytica]